MYSLKKKNKFSIYQLDITKSQEVFHTIKKIHKMTEKQAVKEMEAAGFKLKENIGNLPWQHCMIFEKE